jgi:peptidoglycan/LPS O-acetylase OafA/YrhL
VITLIKVPVADVRSARSFYRPELDVVRFIAFFLVFIHHTLPRDPKLYDLPPAWAHLLASMVNAGGFGLSVFFTLSAYLICELLLREKSLTGKVDMSRFYKRRILRIWPLYFLGLMLGAVWAFHYGNLRNQVPWLAAYALMVGNIFMGSHGWGEIAMGPAGPLWSISLEEQFYVIWPSVVRFCSERRMCLVAWGVIAVANLSLLYLGLRHADGDGTVWYNSFVQFYLFGAGVLLSIYLRGRMPTLSSVARIGLALCAPCCWFFASFAYNLKTRGHLATVGELLPGYLLVVAGCLALMLSLMGVKRVPAWMATLGRLSYGLYVFHMLAIIACLDVANRLHVRHLILVTELPIFLVTLGLASLSYKYFEAPFRRWKDRAAIIHSQPPESPAS